MPGVCGELVGDRPVVAGLAGRVALISSGSRNRTGIRTSSYARHEHLPLPTVSTAMAVLSRSPARES
jgi:hypothetical protein